MNNYVFFFKHITVGGAELLIEKIARQLGKDGDSATLICVSAFPEMEARLQNSGMTIVRCEKRWDSEIRAALSSIEKPICITFEWDIFLEVFHMCIPGKKTLFYAIDYEILAFGKNRDPGVWQRIEHNVVTACIKKLAAHKNIICMDEQTVRCTKGFFQDSTIQLCGFPIVRIPVDIPQPRENILQSKWDNPKFEILSIARADFPFKGYLVGLVEFMKQTDENVILNIVSYGNDIEVLREVIGKQGEDIQKRIALYGKMDYDLLEPLFERAKLYIGMGTTIIDSSARGILAVPVVARTYDLIATHFFHEDYRDVALDDIGENKIEYLYKTVRHMTQEKYFELARQARYLTEKHYSTYSTTQSIKKHADSIAQDRLVLSVLGMYVFRRITKAIRLTKNKLSQAVN